MEWDDIFLGILLNSEARKKDYIEPFQHVIKSHYFCEGNVICYTAEWLHYALCDIY